MLGTGRGGYSVRDKHGTVDLKEDVDSAELPKVLCKLETPAFDF